MAEIKFHLSREEFVDIARKVASRDTASPINQEKWTKENPFFGHCAIASVAAQDIFGGILRRASLAGVEGCDPNDSHYWLKNCLDRPEFFDPTAEQFKTYPQELDAIAVDRPRTYTTDPVRFPDSVNRYKIFALRFASERVGGNPLLDDETYKACLFRAFDSPCQKMKFGTVAKVGDQVVASEANFTHPSKTDCEKGCVRLSVTSRLDQDKGSCDHAEEWTLLRLRENGIDPVDCEIAVAGIYGIGSGLPYIKTEAVFTCPRCAPQLEEAGIKAVHVPVIDHWERIPGDQLVKQAKEYVAKLK